MRTTTLFILTAILVAIPFSAAVGASSSQNAMKDCNTQWKALDTATKSGTTHNAFMSSCMKGAKADTAGSTADSMMNGASNAVGNAANSVGNTVGSAASTAGHAASNAWNSTTHAVGSTAGAAGAAVTGGVAAASSSMAGATKTASHAHHTIPVEGNSGTAARCNDGTTMQIHTHSGACSHHGGVAAWL
jgi:hypothetical protein